MKKKMGREIEKQAPQEQESYTVDHLVSLNPYNPDILPDLENYVNQQFEPERMSTQIVSHILVKALMAMPAPDFSLCLYLIPERVQLEEHVKTLIVLSHYLETARFHQFWAEAAKSRHLLDVVPDFEQAIRAYAVHVLSITHQKIPRAVLAEAINMEGASLDKFLDLHVANSGWKLEKSQTGGQFITLPPNEFNRSGGLYGKTADSIRLEHITRIFPILS